MPAPPRPELTAAAEFEVAVAEAPKPRLSVVIVTYGAGREVVETIRSLVRHTPAGAFEIIVVDNPKGDDRSSLELLRSSTAGVRLVPNDRNIGFGPANDMGVAAARGELICLCNPDIMVPSGWLPPLERALADPVVAIAAPVLVNADGSLQEAGQLLLNDGNTIAIGGPELFPGDWSQAFARDVDYASAALWLLRRSEYLGFNPALVPAYFEDVDYALRLDALGRVTRLVPDRPVTHAHASVASEASRAIAERSREIFRAEWSTRLAQQPARPTDEASARAARDHACPNRVEFRARSAWTTRRAARQATMYARANPRDRSILVADRLAQPDAHALAAAGVEVRPTRKR